MSRPARPAVRVGGVPVPLQVLGDRVLFYDRDRRFAVRGAFLLAQLGGLAPGAPLRLWRFLRGRVGAAAVEVAAADLGLLGRLAREAAAAGGAGGAGAGGPGAGAGGAGGGT